MGPAAFLRVPVALGRFHGEQCRHVHADRWRAVVPHKYRSCRRPCLARTDRRHASGRDVRHRRRRVGRYSRSAAVAGSSPNGPCCCDLGSCWNYPRRSSHAGNASRPYICHRHRLGLRYPCISITCSRTGPTGPNPRSGGTELHQRQPRQSDRSRDRRDSDRVHRCGRSFRHRRCHVPLLRPGRRSLATRFRHSPARLRAVCFGTSSWWPLRPLRTGGPSDLAPCRAVLGTGECSLGPASPGRELTPRTRC